MLAEYSSSRLEAHTAICILLDLRIYAAFVRLGELLEWEVGAGVAEAATIHGLLQGITLPAKDVIAVLAVASAMKLLVSLCYPALGSHLSPWLK